MSGLAIADIPVTPAGMPARMQEIQARLVALQPTRPGLSDPPSRTAGGAPTATVPFATALTGALDQYASGAAPTSTVRGVTATLPGASGTVGTAGAAGPAGTTGTAGSTAIAGPGSGGSVTGDAVVADARRYLGVPYVWGGETPQGLDCSGLVQLTFHDLGISLPRVAADQAHQGTEVPSLAQARPGDLLAFGNPAHHIAIYLGDNKLLEAPEPGKDVHITDVYRTPSTIRRIVPPGGTASGSPTASGAQAAASPLAAPPLADTGLAVSTAMADVPRAVPWSTIALPTVPTPVPATVTGAGATAALPHADWATASAPTAGRTATQLMAAGISGAVAAYADQFAAAESRFALPSGMLAAVAQQESSGDAGAVSPAGAQGLMQLMPSTAHSLGVTDPFDPRQAIPGAARLLADNLRQFGGSVPLALAAYNAGPAAVTRYGGVPPYRETQQYVRSVTDMLGRLA